MRTAALVLALSAVACDAVVDAAGSPTATEDRSCPALEDATGTSIPVVLDVSPAYLVLNGEGVLTGAGFGDDPAALDVTVSDVPAAAIVSVTDSSLTFVMPSSIPGLNQPGDTIFVELRVELDSETSPPVWAWADR